MAIDLERYRRIFVVCCEAGAAEVASSFIRRNDLKDRALFCLEGPAKAIFERKLGFLLCRVLEEIKSLIPGRDVVITGRSLVPELERDAIRLCRARKVKVITFLDHWTNYEESFIPVAARKNSLSPKEFLDYLPDEVIVGDPYAADMIKNTRIPLGIVRFHENEYFNDLKDFFAKRKKEDERTALYLSEPVFEDIEKIYGNGNLWGYNEYDILRDLLASSSILSGKGYRELVIRPHPNEDKEKYAPLVAAKRTGMRVRFSSRLTLEEEIADSALVIGVESMGLIVAVLAGKRAISYLPKSAAKRCSLPHEELIKIDDMNLLEKVLA